MTRAVVEGPCPSCGDTAQRETFDIGSGPELSCYTCEWCWGAEGQDLEPLRPRDVRQLLQEAYEARVRREPGTKGSGS